MGEAIVSRGPQRGERGAAGNKALIRSRQASQKTANTHDLSLLNGALSALKATGVNFALRFINDATMRRQYIAAIDSYANEILIQVKRGTLTPEEGARLANSMRNEIMTAVRLTTSDVGRARAKDLKPSGLTLDDLKEKYAQKLFNRRFADLPQHQKNQVALEIVEAAGRANPKVNTHIRTLGKLGRGLVVFSLGVAVYNVAVAEDKTEAAAREGVAIGGGVLGGAAGGAAAGLLFGPAAPVAVPIGVFVGGIMGALGAEITFDLLKD